MKQIRRNLVVITLTLAVTLAQAAEPAKPGPTLGAPETTKPTAGAYQHVWLEFAGGAKDGGPTRAFVAVRDGKAVSAWMLDQKVPGAGKVKIEGAYRLLVDGMDLTVGDQVRGTINMRQVSIWAPITRFSVATLSIEATRKGQAITGTWKVDFGTAAPAASGALTGNITEESAIRAGQKFADTASWPSWYGPFGTSQASPTTAKLVDDPNQAVPLWRSEERLLSAWGSGVDQRYASRAAHGTVNGGGSSPVFAGGKLFVFQAIPAGAPDPEKLNATVSKMGELLPQELAGMTDNYRPRSDTTVICIDPATGATLWRTRLPLGAPNIQTHKWRGVNPTPCVIGQTLIVNDYAGNWAGLNTADGQVRWTIAGGGVYIGAVSSGPRAIIVTAKGVQAIDPLTGSNIWTATKGDLDVLAMQVLPFGAAGHERLLTIGYAGTRCFDGLTGKELWKLDPPVGYGAGPNAFGSPAQISGDILVGYVSEKGKPGGNFQGYRLKDTGAEVLWRDEFLALDENLTVSIGNGRGYLVGREEVRCVDLVTGKLLAKRVFDKNGPGSNQWLGILGDRLLLAPEGQHGGQGFHLLDAGDLRSLGGFWVPPHNSTTAYAYHALAFPVVDGRVFIRGGDGLYCYDLRKP